MKVNTHQQERMLSQKQTFQVKLNVFGIKKSIYQLIYMNLNDHQLFQDIYR